MVILLPLYFIILMEFRLFRRIFLGASRLICWTIRQSMWNDERRTAKERTVEERRVLIKSYTRNILLSIVCMIFVADFWCILNANMRWLGFVYIEIRMMCILLERVQHRNSAIWIGSPNKMCAMNLMSIADSKKMKDKISICERKVFLCVCVRFIYWNEID